MLDLGRGVRFVYCWSSSIVDSKGVFVLAAKCWWEVNPYPVLHSSAATSHAAPTTNMGGVKIRRQRVQKASKPKMRD